MASETVAKPNKDQHAVVPPIEMFKERIEKMNDHLVKLEQKYSAA